MKYKVTLNGRTYEVEVEAGQAMLLGGGSVSGGILEIWFGFIPLRL